MADPTGLPPNSSPTPTMPLTAQPPNPLGPTNPLDIATIIQQASSTPQYQQATGRLEDIAGRERGIESQSANIPIPKMGPSIDKSQGVLHNLGQALLMLGTATGIGRDVNKAIYQPGINRYVAQKQSLAAQLAALKDEEAVPTEELRGLTGLAQAGGMAAYRSGQLTNQADKNKIAKANSETKAQAVANNYALGQERAAQGWQRLDLGQQQLKAKEVFEQGVLAAMHERTAAGMDENEARIQATEDTKAAMAENAPSILRLLTNQLGITPPVQVAPGAQPSKPATSTTPAAKPGAAKPAAKNKGGAVKWGRDAQGNPVKLSQ